MIDLEDDLVMGEPCEVLDWALVVLDYGYFVCGVQFLLEEGVDGAICVGCACRAGGKGRSRVRGRAGTEQAERADNHKS